MSGEEEVPEKQEGEGEAFDFEAGELKEEIGNEEDEFEEEPKKKHKRRKHAEYIGEAEEEVGNEEEDEDEYYEDDLTSSEGESSDSSYEDMEAVPFEWEDEMYEFVRLVKPKRWGNIFVEKPVEEDNYLTDKKRYLQVVDSLYVAPVQKFLQNLDEEEIDLGYYGINPKGMKGIYKALQSNTKVQHLSLKDNKLTEEACYYLGVLLLDNKSLSHLDLTGCRIGANGVKALVDSLSENETLRVLNLAKCYIGDEGMKTLSTGIKFNNGLHALNLSYNNLAKEGAEALGSCFTYNSNISDLDLNYNDMFDLGGIRAFFKGMMENDGVMRLVLSWNGLAGEEIGKIVTAFLKKRKMITYLDLSANRLDGLAIHEIQQGLQSAENLQVLKLGKNPISSVDLDSLLETITVMPNLKILDLEDLWVKKSFMQTLNKITETREIEVVIGGVISNYEIKGPDYQKILLNRAHYEAMKPKVKKAKKDFGHFLWSLGDEPISKEEFMERVKRFKAKISSALFPELLKEFQISKTVVDVKAMREKYLTLYPTSQPPLEKKKKDEVTEDEAGKEETAGDEKAGMLDPLEGGEAGDEVLTEEGEGDYDEEGKEMEVEEFFLEEAEEEEEIKIEAEMMESNVKETLSIRSLRLEEKLSATPIEIFAEEPLELRDQTEDDA